MIFRFDMRVLLLLLSLLLPLLGGCGEESPAGIAAADSTGAPLAPPTRPYRVVLSGAIIDTLRGSARFGPVRNPTTGKEMLLVKLESQVDLTGGVVLFPEGDSLPAPGTYKLVKRSDLDSASTDQRMAIVYRKDLSRFFVSRSGSVTIDVSTDTLLAGSFNGILEGRLTQGSRIIDGVEIRARGEFRARPGSAGYLVGM